MRRRRRGASAGIAIIRLMAFPSFAVCCLALMAVAVAGCGGSGGVDVDRDAAERLRAELRDERFGYSLRYPRSWRGPDSPTKGQASNLSGGGRRSCFVVGVSALREWEGEDARRDHFEEIAKRGRREIESSGDIEGENAEGFTAVIPSGAGKRGLKLRSAIFASGGVGVQLGCTAPPEDFEGADEEVFLPMLATVRIRRSPAAEELQPKLLELEGVDAAGVRFGDDLASANLSIERRQAGVPAVKRAIELLAEETGRDRRVGVQATVRKEPANPVIGNYDPRTRRAFVQALPNPPQRYRLGG
jgi:hypothetical protein